METVLCRVCDFDYTHIIGMIEVKEDDRGRTTEVMINHQHSIMVNVDYNFRSQGNLHILFRCESGHYFIKSFDGHKGMVFTDENILMNDLADYLNGIYEKDQKLSLIFDYTLLGNIEQFLMKRQEEKV